MRRSPWPTLTQLTQRTERTQRAAFSTELAASAARHRRLTLAAAFASIALIDGSASPASAFSKAAATAMRRATYATYGAPRIHLKGTARVQLGVSTETSGGGSGAAVISGIVTDDALNALAAVVVTLSVRSMGSITSIRSLDATADHEDDTTTSAWMSLATTAPETCDVRAARIVLETSARISMSTDASGRFCVRLHLPPDAHVARYVAHVEVAPTPLLDAASVERGFDLRRSGVILRFVAERLTLPLESDSAIDVTALVSGAQRSTAAGLPLRLVFMASGATTPVGQARTDSAGHARFVIGGARLAPGVATLRAIFAGDALLAASERDVPVEVRARVRLEAPLASEGVLPAASADGVTLRVRASTVARFASRPAAAAYPTGVVEALMADGDTVVGAGALTPLVPTRGERADEAASAHDAFAAESEATFAAALPATARGALPLRLRYVPDAPWFESAQDLHVAQPVKPPGPWGKLAMAAAGVLALSWFVAVRIPDRLRGPVTPFDGRANAGRAGSGLRIVHTQMRGEWSGRVIDAHDGRPIANAVVRVERPAFGDLQTVRRVSCDADGRFTLNLRDDLDAAPRAGDAGKGEEDGAGRPGDRMIVEGDLHLPLRASLPPAGEIVVALVARRRAVLETLIAWARRRGGKFDARPEATPGHVRRAADAGSVEASWAAAVERAAFGRDAVDSARQAEVDRLGAAAGAIAVRDADETPAIERSEASPTSRRTR